MKISVALKDGSPWEVIEVADRDGLRAMDSEGEEVDLFGHDRNKIALVEIIREGLREEAKS